MIPSKPNMSAQEAKRLLLALTSPSSIQKRTAQLYCQKEKIPLEEMQALARQIAGPGPAKSGS
jgi:hypothetical protein